MRSNLLTLAAELSQRGEPFVIATVVRREAPSSARSGDSALITQDGTLHGWLGGSCTRPTVVKVARQALRDGLPRLVAISPDPRAETRPGVEPMPMTCHSGGSVDVYIQPVLPALRLLVYGISPAAQALVRIGKVMGYSVEAIDPDADAVTFPEADFVITDPASRELVTRAERDRARLMAVVASHGAWDEDALEHALGLAPAYLGIIASHKRFGEIESVLRSRGVSPEAMQRIHCPAGLDIGAVSPEEIALSVMTEIVQVFRSAQPVRGEADVTDSDTEPSEAIDPVCGMTVDLRTARHRAEVAGRTFVFCSVGCRERFIAEPAQFVSKVGERG